MSIHENIQIFHPVDIEQYLALLLREYGATEHPEQAEAFLLEELPFYKPQMAEGYIFILSFNMRPLSYLLIQALADHPELAPAETKIIWTQEQDLLLETTVGEVKNRG